MKSYNHHQHIRPPEERGQIGLGADAGGSASDDEAAAVDFSAIWTALWRGKWIILLTCVLVTGGVVGYTYTLTPIYESTAMVSVESATAGPMQIMPMGGEVRDLNSEIGILRYSGKLANRVAARVYALADTMGDHNFPVLMNEEGTERPSTYEVIERMREKVSFAGLPSEGLIEISVQSEARVEAMHLANIYAKEYRDVTQEMSRSGVVAARQFLEQQLGKRRDDILELEREWEAFARTNQVATRGEGGERLVEEYTELSAQRDRLSFQLEQERTTLGILEEQLRTLRPNLQSSLIEEQEVTSLQSQIEILEREIARLKAQADQFYINNPSLRGNEDQVPELADLNRRITSFEQHQAQLTEQLVGRTKESEQVAVGGMSLARIGRLNTQIEEQKLTISQLSAQIESVEKNLEQYRDQLQGIPRQTIEGEQLQRRLDQAEEFYRDIVGELQRTILAEESELGYVNVVREAGLPGLPVSPNMEVNAILGLLLGIGFGVGLAFLMQAANTRLYGPDDVQNKGYSVAGLIPRMDDEIKAMYAGNPVVELEGRQVSTSLMPLLNPWSPITENYRLIRTNLQHARGTAGAPQITMLTSPEPGDGKTTTAVNLAIAMALSGRRVLLVDGDMRRPTVHKALGIKRGPGLGEVLASETLGGADVLPVQQVGVEGLDVLTSGHSQRVTAEALDSNRMKQLLLTVRASYDAIVIDTPPVLAASDPLVVAPQSDATLVVVSTATTESEALHATRDALAAIGVRIAGVILNRYTPESSGGYQYGYGYDRQYEYAAE